MRQGAPGLIFQINKMSKITKKEIDWLVRDKYQGKKPESKKLDQDIARFEMGEPIDYIIGWKEFLGCRIDLSMKPLIPREETEFWVGETIRLFLLEQKKPAIYLDLFAGSGCVGVAVIKNCPNVKVTFGEKDKKLIEQIKKNLKLNKVSGKVIHSDIFSNIKEKFDIILANPPYIPNKKSVVQKSVKKYEPASALWGGKDGLFFIDKFLAKAQNYLKPEGKIFMEFGAGQKSNIERSLKKYSYKKWQFKKDQFERWRFVVVEL